MNKQSLSLGATRKPALLNSLTSLRFFAVLLVFFWHSPLPALASLRFLELGYVGVAFFYILSGFILTYVYYKSIASRKKGSIQKFYVSRIAKLFPVHLLTFVISIPLMIGIAQTVFVDNTKLKVLFSALVNVTLTQAWIPSNKVNFAFNGAAWSISVELFFYLVFPLIILMLVRFKDKLTITNLLLIMTAIWLVALIGFVVQTSPIDDWKLYIFPPARLPEFTIGVLLGIIYLKSNGKQLLGYRIGHKEGTILEIASVLGVALFIGASTLMPQSIRFSLWLIPVMAFLIYVFSYEKGILSSFLNKRVAIFLGEASFSFYMTHQLIIRYLQLIDISPLGLTILSLILSIAVSSLVYMAFEEPLRIRLKNFLLDKLTKPTFLLKSSKIVNRLLRRQTV